MLSKQFHVPAGAGGAAPLRLFSALLCCAPAFAQALPESTNDIDTNAALQIGSVEVSARRSGPLSARDMLTSVDIVAPEQIQQQQVSHAWQLFARAPGVMLTQFRQGNESGKLSFRGFNGEGEVNAVKLLIDGMPANDNAGGMPFLDMLFPLEISNIEVVRGTNDPRYGLHNIAGNATVNTRTGGNYDEARLGYGSFNTRQAQFVKGVEAGNWTQNYSAGYLRSAGYRENAGFRKVSVAGKWGYTTDDGSTRILASARRTQSDGDEAGYLEEADAHRAPASSYAYARSTGGQREMSQLGLAVDTTLSPELSLSAKVYANAVRDQRWLRYSLRTSQQERIIDETHYGVLASLSYRPQWLRAASLEAGVNAEHQNDRSPRYSTVDKVRTATTRDQRFDFDNYGGYLQAVLTPLEGLKLMPGYRIDKVQGSFSDPSKNAHFPIQDYGLIKQPKFSAAYSPWRTATVHANWGRTFQVGAGAAAYRGNANVLRPSINDGWETGVKWAPLPWLDGRLAAWRQDASDEVKRKLNDPAGDSENVGKTRREGIDLQLNAHGGNHAGWIAYARQRSRIVEPDPAAPATLGKQIDHVPNHVFSAGYDWNMTTAVKLSAWANGQGSYFLTSANIGRKYGAYVLLNLGASYRVSPSLSFDLQLNNVADRYVDYVWINDVTRHAPGDGRALTATASLRF